MKKIYDLKKQDWKNDMLHVHCPQSKAYVPLIEDENGVGCGINPDLGDYDYTTMISKEKYSTGTTLGAKFTFKGVAAPLLVVSEEIGTNGTLPMLKLFFEVVAWRNGCNIWRLDHLPENKEPLEIEFIFDKPDEIVYYGNPLFGKKLDDEQRDAVCFCDPACPLLRRVFLLQKITNLQYIIFLHTGQSFL